jgi:hypothetical protein
MAGSLDLFDSQWLTNQETESDPRRSDVGYLQVHHTAYPSTSGARALMDPGGRTVSANGLLDPDGHLYEVVLLSRRAYTSATGFDHNCLTVETVNTTGGPTWGISEASRLRLAHLAVAMFRAGILGSLTRAHIIGHGEVPGTYATACPGPDMHLDHICELAQAIHAGVPKPKPIQEDPMYNLTFREDGAGMCTSIFGSSGVPTVQIYELLFRLRNAPQLATPFRGDWTPGAYAGKPDVLNNAEYAITDAYLALHRKAALAGIQLDDTKLRAALSDALKGAVLTVDSEIDADELAKAFETVIPRVSAAIVKQAGDKLAA